MGLNLASVLTDSAAREPDRTALRFMGVELSYAQMEEASARAATLFRESGLERGDRVALMLPNVPDFVTAYFGALRAGVTVVPFSPLLKDSEVAYILDDCEAKALIAFEDFLGPARAGAKQAGLDRVWASTRPDGDTQGLELFAGAVWSSEPFADTVQTEAGEVAVVLYTSGTTGAPKGACLTHANMTLNVLAFTEVAGAVADDVLMAALPLFHSFGQTCVMNTAFRLGATVSLIPRFEPEPVLDAIVSDRVSIFAGVPAMYAALMAAQRQPRDVSTLRECFGGGSGVPVEIIREFEQQFGAPLFEGYGLSETSPMACMNRIDSPLPGSIGTPLWGVEMKIVDDQLEELAPGEVGEVAIRGHCVMAGYLNRPEATAEAITEDGWLLSGDLGRMDEEGHFFIVDRKKELIIRGGENVYPREIEEVLHQHPAVAFAAVVGVEDERLGEEVAALVQLNPGGSAEPAELIDFVKERLAAYKYPRHLAIVDELPLGASGKVLKKEIDTDAALQAAVPAP